MKINGKNLGEGEPVYLIAEISANHNGNIELAKQTILEAHKSGADAVKIQTYTPETITLKSTREEFRINDGLWKGQTLFELYEKGQTPFEWHEELFEFARSHGITLFSSPFDISAVKLLETLRVPAYKIASMEIVDHPLIDCVSSKLKPIFMSTGSADLAEIEDAVWKIKQKNNSQLLLFHCISAYPAKLEESNLNSIRFLKDRFNVSVGLSDHTIGSEAAVLSVALGAVAIEKHFTLDRSLGGLDSAFSSMPDEFKDLRKRIDEARAALGEFGIKRSKSEDTSTSIRKSIYFVKNLKKGEEIDKDTVRVIRPAAGLHPKHLSEIYGMKLKYDVRFGDPVTWEAIEIQDAEIKNPSRNFCLQEILPTNLQIETLYTLLKSRAFGISHIEVPTFAEHSNFVRTHPYRYWALVVASENKNDVLGSTYVGFDNSIGVDLKFDKIDFSADFFLQKLRDELPELPECKSKIPKHYFFNVSPRNIWLKNWLKDSKFVVAQHSFVVPECSAQNIKISRIQN